ncbi:hypothetical protein RFH42_07485 [Acinetobacter rudis]|uniref:hypothetical protein n=1 Tax=Acinetobacter rudis TaxID=632955 RepID=UPI00280FEA35|nr:hypothetical protein [Acinetobacter rudis]MDQ8952806.1 hypothetical protein [Acinetobacter rudis]
MLLSRKYYFIIKVLPIFILIGCTFDSKVVNSQISSKQRGLLTYNKIIHGGRPTFTGGTIKVENNCVYLTTGIKKDIPIIFPKTFKLIGDVISDEHTSLKVGQDIRVNGYMISINENSLKSLDILENSCLDGFKRAWIYTK